MLAGALRSDDEQIVAPGAHAGGEAHRLLGGADQRLGLVAALLVLRLGVAVGDDTAARLHDQGAVLDQPGAQRDAGIHAAVGGEVADAAAIESAPLGFQLVDDLHRPHLRRAGDGAGRESGPQRRQGVVLRIDAALDVRDDVHHVGVPLDDLAFGHPHGPHLGHAADVVAAQVQ